jgi:hypothetical protein
LKDDLIKSSRHPYLLTGNSTSLNAIKVDRQSEQYPEYLKTLILNTLTRLIKLKSKEINHKNENKRFLEQEKASYKIGFSDVTIEKFNRDKNNQFLGSYLYKTPALGELIPLSSRSSY